MSMRIRLGIPLSLGQIAEATAGTISANKDLLITHICTDTRELVCGDLFIALKGERYNGADFVAMAKEKGALILSSVGSTSDVFHPDTRLALLNLASFYAKNLPYLLYRIGITGSVGKTTTKEFLKILLSERYITHASEGNFNNEIGLPLSILSAKEDTEFLLMELGMNSRGEISRLSKCLEPDIAVITNIGTAHIGRLGSREEIARAKMEILDGMKNGKIIVPKEENLLSKIKEKETFSIADTAADYYIKSGEKASVEIYKRGEKFCSADFALPEEHHRKCLAAAAATAISAGISANQLSHGVSLISRDNIRQTMFWAEDYCFYADCYNASRESMLSAIEAFEKAKTKGKKSLLLGDILETGDKREEIHIEIGRAISPEVISNLFLFGEHAYEIGRGAAEGGFPTERIFISCDITKPQSMAEQIRLHSDKGESILVKASHAIGLERVLACFKKDEERRDES